MKLAVALFLLVALFASFALCSNTFLHNNDEVAMEEVASDDEEDEISEDEEESDSDSSVVLRVEKDSNAWWIQVKVSPAGAKNVDLYWNGHHATATKPAWDHSAGEYFIGKPSTAIPAGAQVTAKIHMKTGKTVTVKVTWKDGATSGGSSGSSGSSGHSSGGGKSGGLPKAAAGKPIKHAHATWYDATAAGTPVCGFNTKFCGSPSDATGLVGPCGKGQGKCQNCPKGYCFGPSCVPPNCEKKGCGRKIKVWCVDDAAGACKTKEPVIMTVNNVCPSQHPCNTCKHPNPCASKDHFDLCQATFFEIAHKQPSAKGLKIAYQLMD